MNSTIAMIKHVKLLFIFLMFLLVFYFFLVSRYRPRYTLSEEGIWERFNLTVYTSSPSPSVAKTMVTEETKPTTNSTTSKPTVVKKILFWTPPVCNDCAPFSAFKHGNAIFKKNNCEYQNCYITPNYKNLSTIDPENYDALMFNGRPTLRMNLDRLPKKRRDEQVYIFVQLESAPRFPVCQSHFDDFFNWTVTYRLDSDIPWTYFEVRTMDNVTVGPKKHMEWAKEDDLGPPSADLLRELNKKTKLAAWFVSNCNNGNSDRMGFMKKLDEILQRIDNDSSVHIYGKCGKYDCSRKESERCNNLIDKDYMFYMALENSFDEDYITEKVMKGLQHNALPVVYSAVDYNRFLPPKSYLDAVALGPEKLAKKMIELYEDRQEYAQYFKWKSKYTFWDNFSNANVACKICEKLNIDKDTTRHRNFREWWKEDYASYCKKRGK